MSFVRWLVASALCIVIVGLLGAIKFNQIQAAIAFGESFPEPSETVQVETVAMTQWRPSMTVFGEVLAPQSVELRNEFEGRIASVGFESGGLVEKGQILIQLDISEEQAQLDALNAEIRLAELEVSRFARLLESNASSREQLDRASAQRDAAVARARALQAIIDKKTLLAPIAGKAGLHQFEAGEFLSANTMVTRLVGDTPFIWIDFSLPQAYDQLSVGETVSVALDSAAGTKTFSGSVKAIDNVLSQESRSIKVRAQVAKDAALRAGKFVSIGVPVGEPEDAISLPISALRYDTFGSFVYVLQPAEDNKLRAVREDVTVMEQSKTRVYLAPTLEQGAQVATIGSYKLKPNMWTKTAETSGGNQ